jgi:hypothetical protein
MDQTVLYNEDGQIMREPDANALHVYVASSICSYSGQMATINNTP